MRVQWWLHQYKLMVRAAWLTMVFPAHKSLTFSVLLKPSFLLPTHAFDLSICVALALSDSLNKLRSGFKIKWPNDIYFEDKKIAGVLIENQMNDLYIKMQ